MRRLPMAVGFPPPKRSEPLFVIIIIKKKTTVLRKESYSEPDRRFSFHCPVSEK
jgi:hypothetical protein